MKRRHKLNLAMVLFLLFTAGIMSYILKDLDRKDNYKQPSSNVEQNAKKIESTQGKEKIEEIFDWLPIIKKYREEEISKIKTEEKVVALTFDAGANADGVEKTLKILEEEKIKGTFFLTGKFIETYPLETKMIINSGGDLGNHSYSHPYFTQISKEEMTREIEKTKEMLSVFGEKFDPFFRFPYGDRNFETREIVNDNSYINIRWTIDSLGWKGTSGGETKESVENRIISKTVPGAIIMMHLGSNPEDKSHLDSEALPLVILKLREEGYEFKTISELLKEKNH